MILMLDNYDSFTYNLVQYLGELGAEVHVFRNDEISVEEVESLRPSHIVISPGPCTPNEAGVTLELVARMAGRVPLLGVCLGHQAIGQAFGAKVVRAKQVMHGKTSRVRHDGKGVFERVEDDFVATRYHSLVVERASLPACLEVTAASEDGEIMGLRHRGHAIEGVQFHPEALLTQHGHKMLQNFIQGK
jgi:anthranilate synthase/aminodeoxychorismate synthase-like glutamine amidotransferase